MNPAIWVAFLYIHCCPFQHIWVIYLHDPQHTSLDTTSDQESHLEEDKLVPPFMEKVHWELEIHFSIVQEGASFLMRHISQIRDSVQVPWQAFTELSLLAIGISENQLIYQPI